MSSFENNVEDSFVAKIESLLEEVKDGDSSYFSSAERTLVALVMLSRVTEDHHYQKIWHEHGEEFLTFCQQWVVGWTREKSPRDEVLPIRWVVVWTRRLIDSVPQGQIAATSTRTLLGSLRNILWGYILRDDADFDVETDCIIAETEAMECLLVLEQVLPTNDPASEVDSKLTSFVHRIQKYQPLRTEYSTKAKIAVHSPQDMMEETLRQLLPVQVKDETNGDTTTIWNRFESTCQALLLQMGKLVMSTNDGVLLPTVWSKICTQWWDHQATNKKKGDTNTSDTDRRRGWTRLLLEMMIAACQSVQPVNASLWYKFWCLDKRWNCWTRLLTSCFAADDSLRPLAWTATAHVIETTTWPKILSLDAPTMWTAIIVRLAVGEAKIQLGWIISTTELVTEDRTVLVQSTCRVIVQCVDLIDTLSKDKEEGQSSEARSRIPVSSIQALHRSLEEALDTVEQYLNLADRRLPEIDAPVILVLGCLLTEFDVFIRPQYKQNHGGRIDGADFDDEKNENAALLALSVAMQICPLSSRHELLLGLTAVLASAEGDNTRVELLKQNKVLEENVVQLLKTCWTDVHAVGLSTIPVACDLIDILLDVTVVRQSRELQSTIVKWIEKVASDGTFIRVDLEMSLSCFVKLQGNMPPNDFNANIINMAYQRLMNLD